MFKRIAKFFESLFMAITFTEAGEFDTAREILRQTDIDRKKDRPRKQPQLRPQMRA